MAAHRTDHAHVRSYADYDSVWLTSGTVTWPPSSISG